MGLCLSQSVTYDQSRTSRTVKRDLLREPVFNLRVHRNLADAVLGTKTVEEIFDEMERQREQKPH